MNRSLPDLCLTDIIKFLKADIPSLRRDEFIKAVERLTVADREILEYASFSERQYSRNVLIRESQFEILIMCWKSGQRSLIHDHGGSFGVVKVLRGILTESVFVPALNGMIKADASRDYQEGDIQVESPATIHQVSNLQPQSRNAISVHFYIPPLSTMNVYQLYDIVPRPILSEMYNNGAGI